MVSTAYSLSGVEIAITLSGFPAWCIAPRSHAFHPPTGDQPTRFPYIIGFWEGKFGTFSIRKTSRSRETCFRIQENLRVKFLAIFSRKNAYFITYNRFLHLSVLVEFVKKKNAFRKIPEALSQTANVYEHGLWSACFFFPKIISMISSAMFADKLTERQLKIPFLTGIL